jgi:iron complex transport system substrate-binding protein
VQTLVRPDAAFQQIVDELTRRGFLTGAAGAATLLGLAGCGADPAPASSGAPTAPASRTVDTAAGEVEVPADPARVVCIDYFSAIFALELGLTPVGGIDYSWVDDASMYPDYVGPLKELADIGEITATNFEKVAALRPDLILGPKAGSRYDNSEGALEKLGRVAPVASLDFGRTGDWRAPFAQAAEVLGRTERLAPLRASYERKVATTRAAYADLLESTVVTVVNYADGGQVGLDLPRSGDGVVLADLGVRFGAASADNGTNSAELSFENVPDLADSDVILYRANADGSPGAGLADLFDQRIWRDLPAVRAGRAHPVGWVDLCTYRWAELAVDGFAAVLDGLDSGRQEP